jgi:hypothetical protein
MKARSWIATVTGATVVLATAVVAAGAGTTAQAGTNTTAGTPTAVDAGSVSFSDKTYPGVVSYSKATATETLSTAKDKCSLVPGGTASYISFAPSAPAGVTSTASYANNSIGVASANKKTGTACYQVNADAGEALKISLDQSPTGPFSTLFGVARAKSANFDMNLAGNAVIQADLYYGDVRVGGAEMQSGFSTPYPVQHPNDQIFTCTAASNSGPQSGSSNNCYWPIDQITDAPGGGYDAALTGLPAGSTYDQTAPGALDWDKVVLTPIVGQFSIQGGLAWPSSSGDRSTNFALESFSDGQLQCGDLVTQTSTLSSDITAVSVQRLNDLNGGTASSGCTKIDYSLNVDGTLTFHKVYSQDTQAQFLLAVQRKVQLSTTATGSTPQVAALQGDWEVPGLNTTFVIPFCAGPAFSGATSFANYDPASGVFGYRAAGPTAPTTPSSSLLTAANGYDMVPDTKLPNVQYACIYAQSTELNMTTNVLTAYDFVYLTGDFKAYT